MIGSAATKRRVLLLAWLALFTSAPSAGATLIRTVVAVDRPVVQRGDPVIVSVTIEQYGFSSSKVEAPHPAGMAIERAGTSQNVVMAAGTVVRTDVTLFRVTAMLPGKYTIPPFIVELDGKRTETRPVTFEVVASLPPGAGGSEPGAGEEGEDRAGLFARFVVDRRHVSWNEQIVARIQILSRTPLEDMPAWDAPEATGFWGEPLGEPRHDRVSIDGRAYDRYERVVAFFPTRPGRLTLGPARARVHVVRHHEPTFDPLGGLLLSAPTEVVELPLEAAPIDIAVDPLPAGAPPEFQGAVGALSLAVRVDRPRVRVGEPLTVSTAIQGDGNLAAATDPRIVAIPDCPSYPAGARTDLDRSGERLRGIRRRDIAFIPDQPGSLLVLPIAFAWFDPEAGHYRVQRSDTIVVRVDPAKEGSVAAGVAQTALGVPAAPRAASAAPPRAGGKGSAAPSLTGWPGGVPLLSGVLSLVGYAGFGLAASARRRAAKDPRTRRAALLREAAGDLARVAQSPGESRAAERAEALLRDAAGIRFGIDPEGRSRRDLLNRLRAASVEGAEIEAIADSLRRLEQSAFAPGGTGDVKVALEGAAAIARRWSEECRA